MAIYPLLKDGKPALTADGRPRYKVVVWDGEAKRRQFLAKRGLGPAQVTPFVLERRQVADQLERLRMVGPESGPQNFPGLYVQRLRLDVAPLDAQGIGEALKRVGDLGVPRRVDALPSLQRLASEPARAGMVAGGTPFALPGDEALLESSDTAPEDAAETADLLARSEAALAQLPEDARAVVVLRDIEGLSTKEVAELLGVTETVVKVRLHRAHARLRTMLVGPRSGEVGA